MISYNAFKSYLKKIKDKIGDTCHGGFHTPIDKIDGKKEYLVHYYFKYTCTFDFLGDSIVEAANNSIKKGPIKVSTQMDLSCSGLTQLKVTEAILIKKYCDYAKI